MKLLTKLGWKNNQNQTKIEEIQNKLGIKRINYTRDNNFSTQDGIVNLHPTKGTHWFCHIDNSSVHSFGCQPSKLLSDFLVKKSGESVFLIEIFEELTNSVLPFVYRFFT